jgi:hypothetical protein
VSLIKPTVIGPLPDAPPELPEPEDEQALDTTTTARRIGSIRAAKPDFDVTVRSLRHCGIPDPARSITGPAEPCTGGAWHNF